MLSTLPRVTVLVAAVGFPHPALAEVSAVADAAEAASLWVTGAALYLGIAVLLLVALALVSVRERRAWSKLLAWCSLTAEHEDDPMVGTRRPTP
jgi:O-antigen ligase